MNDIYFSTRNEGRRGLLGIYTSIVSTASARRYASAPATRRKKHVTEDAASAS